MQNAYPEIRTGILHKSLTQNRLSSTRLQPDLRRVLRPARLRRRDSSLALRMTGASRGAEQILRRGSE